jgi:hypothetical protein
MSISSSNRKAGPFTGNGTASSFPFYFKVFQASDLLVVLLTEASNLETTLTLTTDYTVTLNANQDALPGGTVVLTAGALSFGYKLTITSDIGNLQPTNLTNQGGFYPDVIEDALDRATIQIQQLAEDLSRAVTVPLSSTASTALPYPQGGTVLGWDDTGTSLINLSPEDIVSQQLYADWKFDTFTGDGTTTSFTLQANPGNIANMDVSVSGVTQLPGTDYTLSGTTISFTTAPALGLSILVRYGQATMQTNVTYSQQVFNVTSGTVGVSGKQTVFTLTSSYIPGNNGVSVYVNGSRLIGGTDYLETSASVITLVKGAYPGDVVVVVTAEPINSTALSAAQVTYTPAGLSAQATTVQAKLRETVSVKDFGAVGNGVTDDTAAIQAAVNAAKKIYFPPGTYLINVVTLNANNFLFGDGVASIIKQSASVVGGSSGSLYAESGSSTTTIDNIVIRDLRVEANNITAPVFEEHTHLISLNGVKNALIENVQFIGFRGDGLYIGSGISGSAERHNINVTVRNCFFDGINQQNRNGISVIDVDGINIINNVFVNLTRNDMPGAIDFEPDGNAFHIIRNLVVTGNVIRNCGGNVACIQIYTPSTVTSPAYNIVLSNNTCENSPLALGLYINLQRGATYTDSAATLTGNTVKNCLRPFCIFGASNVTVNANTFRNFKNSGLVGYLTSDTTAYAVTISNNIFSTTSGPGDGSALNILNANNVIVSGNQFIDIGLSTGGGEYVQLGTTSTSSNVTIVNNIFTATDSRVASAIVQQPTHTTTNSINKFYGNTISSNLAVNNKAWLTDDCGNAVNLFTTATPESSFQIGTSITVVNGSMGASTTGNISSGTSSLAVASGANIANGDQITIAGAGASGAALSTFVLSGGGTTSITLAATASTTVSSAAVTTPGLPSGGFTQGVLTTEKRTKQSGYTAWITQRFIPRNTSSAGLLESYYRKSDTSGLWSAWVKVTGV